MTAELNHTIVPARDPEASAQFLADILGLQVGAPVAHFTPVTLANHVTLDYDRADQVAGHHYTFQLSTDQKSWTSLPLALKAKTTVSGLTVGTTYYFRFQVLTKKGLRDWSGVVSYVAR